MHCVWFNFHVFVKIIKKRKTQLLRQVDPRVVVCPLRARPPFVSFASWEGRRKRRLYSARAPTACVFRSQLRE